MSAQYRLYFVSTEAYMSAMELAARLEGKGLMRRAWRVRLNLDGPQPVEEESACEEVVPVMSVPTADVVAQIIKQTKLSYPKIAAQLGVRRQSVSDWGRGRSISQRNYEKLVALVQKLKEEK
jgi:DNA-binding transcriptional regulator YiaG